jgi:hypothetical protein
MPPPAPVSKLAATRQRRLEVTSISHGPAVSARPRSLPQLSTAAWASIAIVAMWVAVLIDAIWGPDIVSNATTASTTVPSAVVLAFFAFIATIFVARYGFAARRERD